MNTDQADAIVRGAFRTVFPTGDFEAEKGRRRRVYADQLKGFLDLSTESYYRELVKVAFYSGFKASTVTSKMDIVLSHLGELSRVANYSEEDVQRILSAEGMIKNRRKIHACVHNAKVLLEIERKYGSFGNYIRSFSDKFPEDLGNISKLLEDIKTKFKYIGPRTGLHFLMIIGFPLVKPDVIVMRVLHRLGLVQGEGDEYIDQAVEICREIANLSDIPPNFVDELLVKVGQSEGAEVCRKKNPLCEKCGLMSICKYTK